MVLLSSAGTDNGGDPSSAPAADAANASEGIPSEGAESSNASNAAAAASIAADLTTLESTLGVGGAAANANTAGVFYSVPSLLGGRAACESIGTALGGARARLEAATGTGGGASADGGGANANNNAGTSVGGERTLLVRWAPSPPASAC